MFNLFGRKASPPPDIRDTLFGDVGLAHWPGGDTAAAAEQVPWRWFVEARDALAAGQPHLAIRAWQRVAAQRGLESRHYAQAWHFLRAHGVRPSPQQSKQLFGVVLEVPMDQGLDLLAAYPERTARYYNFSGGGVVWERPDDLLDDAIDALLSAGQQVLNAIGPWEGTRPPPPQMPRVRLNLLSPAGLHFGEGDFNVLAADPLGKPMIDAGTALMQRLVTLDSRRC